MGDPEKYAQAGRSGEDEDGFGDFVGFWSPYVRLVHVRHIVGRNSSRFSLSLSLSKWLVDLQIPWRARRF